MKKSLLLIALSCCLVFSAAAQESIYTSNHLIIGLNVSGGFTVVQGGSQSRIEYITANLSFFPEDSFNQQIVALSTNPLAESTPASQLFRWDTSPQFGHYSFSLASTIRVTNRQKAVGSKVSFPLLEVPDNLRVYMSPSETVDSDHPSIIAKANELAKGNDDLYFLVHNVADWVEHNIQYDLSTVTADVTQKSSWVLENRQGVCDELTNLFIGILRALGIPARFVSGVSYTNSELFAEKWGPHGWAEVWFGPDIGWIPWDVTYGEFGYIDPTHIKLKTSIDAVESSVQYQWLGYQIDFKADPLEFDIELEDIEGQSGDLFDVWAESVKSDVGFGSNNLVIAHIKNLQPSYQSITLTLSKSAEIDLLDPHTQHLALLPKGEGVMTWRVKVSDQLSPNYKYTLPLKMTTSTNHSYDTSFSVSKSSPVFDTATFDGLTMSFAQDARRKYSSDLSLQCNQDKFGIYLDLPLAVECVLRNTGTQALTDIHVCIEQDCQTVNLGISQSTTVRFSYTSTTPGDKTVVVSADGSDVHKTHPLSVAVWTIPQIAIRNMQAPLEVSYNDQFTISFNIDIPEKSSSVKDVHVLMSWSGLSQSWDIDELTKSHPFDINVEGSTLLAGSNNVEIVVNAKDQDGKSFSDTAQLNIVLANLTWTQRIGVFFARIERSVASWFT